MRRHNKKIAGLHFTLGAILVLGGTSIFPRSSVVGGQKVEDLSEFTTRLTDLWQGFGEIAKSPNWTPAQDESYISRVDQSISDYVVTRLNSSPIPSATTLELELNRATASAFDGLSFEAMKQGNPAWHGFAFVLQNSPAPPGEYVVIVTIGPGNTPWNVIRGFARRGGSYVSVACAGDDLKNRRLAVDRMESFGPEEVRFLVSGIYIGSPESLTTLVLYSFDGQRFKIIWQRDSVPNAKVSFRRKDVVVYSYKATPGKRPWLFTQEVYAQAPTGLERVKVEHGTVR